MLTKTNFDEHHDDCYARFLKTLRPIDGASEGPAIFLMPAFAPTVLFVAAVGAFLAFFTIVVPVDMAELLLVLLTVLSGSNSSARFSTLFDLVVADLAAEAFGRPAFGFSVIALAIAAVAAAVLAFIGENVGLSGDTGREFKGFDGEPRAGSTGD